MANIRNEIIVAVDFSEDSKAALLWACEYSLCKGSPLLILHVVHDLANAPGFYHQDSDVLQPMEATAEDMMTDFLEEIMAAHPGLQLLKEAKTKLVKGLPPGRIVEVAEKEDAQIIVIGNRGNTGLPHLLLGSVAESVVQTSPIPVVVVKSPKEPGEEH